MKTRRRRAVGRPSKLTPELADGMFEALANGASVKHMLADNDINASTFYKWRAENEEFSKRYEEATLIRHRMLGETLIGLSMEVDYRDARDVLAEAHLLEKAFHHIMGGANSWANRRRQQKSSRR
jgi:hypothetical protein